MTDEILNASRLVADTGKVVGRWNDTPYYDAVENLSLIQWNEIIKPFFGEIVPDYESVLEIAVGHGRMSDILIREAKTFIGVDPLLKNIEFCKVRFADVKSARFLQTDGVTLKEIENGSISFGFCWDSMVHFDSDVIRYYLREMARVLKPGGLFFTHHSNRDAAPTGNFQIAPHARNFMSIPFFQHYAFKEGLEIVKHQALSWGQGDKRFEDLDGLALLQTK